MLAIDPNSKGFFITGTDTGVGKTRVSCALLDFFSQLGKSTLGLKPIATGCPAGISEDGILLQKHSSIKLPYAQVNPVALNPATAPNIASKIQLSAKKLWELCQPALSTHPDCIIVEGAGGWQVPINEFETMANLALLFDLPVILVVGIRLGCINHALLSIESIRVKGVQLAGWIANEIEPEYPFFRENQMTICQHTNAKFLGRFPEGKS